MTQHNASALTGVPEELSYFLNPVAKLLCVLGMGIAALVWPDFTVGLGLVLLLIIIGIRNHHGTALMKLLAGLGLPMLIILGFIQGF